MSEIIPFKECVCSNQKDGSKVADEADKAPAVYIGGVDTCQDEEIDCALFLFEIQFERVGGLGMHRGVIAAVHLEQFTSGKILALELANEAEVKGQLEQVEVGRTQVGTVSALYSDPCCVLEALGENEKQRPADIEVHPKQGVRCRLWKVSGQALFAKAQSVLDKKSLILVQGRSMYEAMLRNRDNCREANDDYSGKEGYDYVAMALSNIDDFSSSNGMVIDPVISTCCMQRFTDIPLLLGNLGEFFEVSGADVDAGDAAVAGAIQLFLDKPEDQPELILYPGGKHLYLLKLRAHEHLQKTEFDEKQLGADSSVVLYQRIILNHIFGITPEELYDNDIFSIPESIVAACGIARSNANCVAFFAPNPNVSQVRDLAWDDIQVPAGLIRCRPLLPSGLVEFSLRS